MREPVFCREERRRWLYAFVFSGINYDAMTYSSFIIIIQKRGVGVGAKTDVATTSDDNERYFVLQQQQLVLRAVGRRRDTKKTCRPRTSAPLFTTTTLHQFQRLRLLLQLSSLVYFVANRV